MFQNGNLNDYLVKVLRQFLPLSYGTKIRVKVTGDCLNQQKITYNHGKVVNIYLVYELEKKIVYLVQLL